MQQLKLLNIRSLKHLALLLKFPEERILELAQNPTYGTPQFIEKEGGKKREINPPLKQLKDLQRQINKKLLQRIVLDGIFHGSVPGRDARSNAKQHIGKEVILKIDIKDFFPSIKYIRVYQLFLQLGCSPQIARILTQLTTYKYRIPQGAPTSSSIANLVLRNYATRIQKLLVPFGVGLRIGVGFTVFVDDMTFSGPQKILNFESLTIKILSQEGFRIKRNKLIRLARTERQEVTGLVVNEKLNIRKCDYRNLRAILNNCAKDDIDSQRSKYREIFGKDLSRSSLLGKINHIKCINPIKGKKLLKQFHSINWST